VALGAAFLLFLLRGESASASSYSYQLLADSTVEAMAMTSQGETHAVEAMYPRAVALSRNLLGPGLMTLRLARYLVVLAVIGVASGGVALAKQVKSSRAAAAAASAKLAKVLDKDCK
jgi:hypothetical protein